MNAFKDDPPLALTTLQKIAEEIPSGVSASDVGKIIQEIQGSTDETVANLTYAVYTAIKENLETVWVRHNIAEKLKNIKNLPKVETMNKAGSHVSFESNLKLIKVEGLQLRKEQLQAKIKQMEDKNRELKDSFKTQLDMIEHQLSDYPCDYSM